MGLGKPGIAGRDAAACPETQGFGLAETSKPLRAGPFTLRACKIPGIREMARRAKAAAAAGFEDSEGFCKSLFRAGRDLRLKSIALDSTSDFDLAGKTVISPLGSGFILIQVLLSEHLQP